MFSSLLSRVYTELRPFVFLNPSPQQRLGVQKECSPTDPGIISERDIPDNMVLCSVYKVGKKRRKGRIFGMKEFVFLTHHYMWESSAFLGWLNTFLPLGRDEWTPCVALPECVTFVLPIRLRCLYLTHKFSHFSLSDSPPSPIGRSEHGDEFLPRVDPQQLLSAVQGLCWSLCRPLEQTLWILPPHNIPYSGNLCYQKHTVHSQAPHTSHFPHLVFDIFHLLVNVKYQPLSASVKYTGKKEPHVFWEDPTSSTDLRWWKIWSNKFVPVKQYRNSPVWA